MRWIIAVAIFIPPIAIFFFGYEPREDYFFCFLAWFVIVLSGFGAKMVFSLNEETYYGRQEESNYGGIQS